MKYENNEGYNSNIKTKFEQLRDYVELKPCPFCGSDVVITARENNLSLTGRYFIECCGVMETYFIFGETVKNSDSGSKKECKVNTNKTME